MESSFLGCRMLRLRGRYHKRWPRPQLTNLGSKLAESSMERFDMKQAASLTEAKRRRIAGFVEDHGETVDAYPLLRWEFGVFYQRTDDLPMRPFRSWLRSIERLVQDIEREPGQARWACGRKHEGVVCPVW